MATNVSRSITLRRDGSELDSQQAAQVNTEEPVTSTTGGLDPDLAPTGDPVDILSKIPTQLQVGVHTLKLAIYDQYANINGSASTGNFVSPYPEGWEHLGVAEEYFRLQFTGSKTTSSDGRTLKGDGYTNFYDKLGLPTRTGGEGESLSEG